MNKFFLSLILILAYLLLINILFSLNFSLDEGNITIFNESSSGAMVDIGVSESVRVSVVRPRIYGIIEESGGQSILYLFKLIPVPLKRANFDFLYLHIPFLILISFLLFRKGKLKGGVEEKWEEPDGGNYYLSS